VSVLSINNISINIPQIQSSLAQAATAAENSVSAQENVSAEAGSSESGLVLFSNNYDQNIVVHAPVELANTGSTNIVV
jgi:hypothetical protein